nr:hypothetical protein [Photorhabdus heterorhabditis]
MFDQKSVPQVYARVKSGDLRGDGALLAGNTVALNSLGDITNRGTVSGRDVTQLTANNLTNHGFIRGGKVDLTAQQTLTNRGGQIQGDDRVTLKGRDIISASTVRGDEANRWLDRPAGIYVQNDKGTLSLSAINNVDVIDGAQRQGALIVLHINACRTVQPAVSFIPAYGRGAGDIPAFQGHPVIPLNPAAPIGERLLGR